MGQPVMETHTSITRSCTVDWLGHRANVINNVELSGHTYSMYKIGLVVVVDHRGSQKQGA